MVLLTMTPAVVAALGRHPEMQRDAELQQSLEDPLLLQPEQGKPISHGQILELYKHIRENSGGVDGQIRLHDLLRGADVYRPPPTPRPEPTSEFKQLMARLRRDEEARAYSKMLNSTTDYKNTFQKFAAPNNAAAWDLTSSADDIDEMKMSDVNRQVALIINVLVSIIACAIAVWLLLRHWKAPARLALSMSCGIIVGIAEVGLYAVYVRKLGEAKSQDKAKRETRSITDTWVIESTKQPLPGSSSGKEHTNKDRLRYRKPKAAT